MYLYKNPEDFRDLIVATSEEYSIPPEIIEKDCYVSAALHELNKAHENLIFRGGTSLSKCFHVIKRFSEDIDISVRGKVTQGQKSKLKKAVFVAVEGLGLAIKNADEIRSGLDYNRYVVEYEPLYEEGISPEIIIETYTGVEYLPTENRLVDNYIYQFLKKIRREDIAERYQLTPFEMCVQDLRRTLIDKVFALCDYYLNNKKPKHSRHIYDIYMLLSVVPIDDELKKLIVKVRELRKSQKICSSALDIFDINQLLEDIISSGYYEQDYSDLTEKLLFVNVKYDEAITGIQKVIISDCFRT